MVVMGFRTNWQVCVFDPENGKPHTYFKYESFDVSYSYSSSNASVGYSSSSSNGALSASAPSTMGGVPMYTHSSSNPYTTNTTITSVGSHGSEIEVRPGDIVYVVACLSSSVAVYHYKTHSFFSIYDSELSNLRPILIEQDAIDMELKYGNSTELEVHIHGA